jgi:adenosylcobinamide kinase/adenosylcobinamide-phosphate guanylyltransferase
MTGSPADETFPQLSVVTGGARSGKSALAERLARAGGGPLTYIATAEPLDDEMRDRIARHRDGRGAGWHTVEAPRDLAGALGAVASGTVLVDCATLWLGNRMLDGADPAGDARDLVAALAGCRGRVVVVTNEVGSGIVPDNALARRFRDSQGRLNQRLAAEAGLVVAVIAGLPLVLKGRLPPGVA